MAISLAGVTALSAETPAATHWSVWETARDNGHRLARVAAAAASDPRAGVVITVNPTQSFQEMIGFGGALTESSAWVLAQLPAERRAEVLRRYYDPKEGLGYTLARTHLNSCDFSLNLWALDETPGDYDLLQFTLDPMRKWLLPLLHDAQGITGADRFKLLVSPWSPPAWMKTNNRMDDGGSLRKEYAATWANYFVRFAQAMEQEELPVWAFTVQNEPEAHQTWESCLFTPEQERTFVTEHLGPAFERAGLASRVKLIGWDHNRDRIEASAAALLGDPLCARYLWGLGVHWYVSDDFAAASRVHLAHPDKPILFTEGCCEGGDALGSWTHGEHYASQMIGDFSNWVAAFIDWNIVLDQRGGPNHVGNFCDAPVIVDTRTKEVRYSASFYYIGQFSRYVRNGAHRIATTGAGKALQAISFANPDRSVVTIVLNTSDAPVGFALSLDDERLATEIPAHAIRTYVYAD
jgi:glucosylceramidase